MLATLDCRMVSKDAWYFIRLAREVLSEKTALPSFEDRAEVQSVATKFSSFTLEVITSEAERKALWRLLAGATDLAQMAYRRKNWPTLGFTRNPAPELNQLKQRAEWTPIYEPNVSVT